MALIAHYPLNGDTKDYSGYGNDAVNNGAVVSEEGKIGGCYETGGSKYINVPTHSGGAGDLRESLSICVWIKPYNLTSTIGYIVSRNNTGGHEDQQYSVDINASRINFVLGGTILGVDLSLTSNEWAHISATWDGTVSRVYVDGELIGSGTRNSPLPYKQYMSIGRRNNSLHFNGAVNDVRIYDHALSDKEVKEIAKAKVLHYKFDEQDLTTKIVKDCSGFGNDGTVAVTTAPTWSEDSPVGRGSMEFNGAQEIDTQGTFNFGKEDYFTISVWINPEGHSSKAGAAAGILGKGHYHSNTWDLFIRNNNSIAFECSGDPTRNGLVQVTSPVMAVNTWANIAVVYNAGRISMYVNGVLHSSTTYNGIGGFTNTNRVYVGKRAGDNTRRFMGNISDVRIYATALSPEDVLELYQTRASVDNEGNLFVQEIDEVTDTSKEVDSRGIARFKEFNEVDGENKMSIKNDGVVYVNEIVEA